MAYLLVLVFFGTTRPKTIFKLISNIDKNTFLYDINDYNLLRKHMLQAVEIDIKNSKFKNLALLRN